VEIVRKESLAPAGTGPFFLLAPVVSFACFLTVPLLALDEVAWAAVSLLAKAVLVGVAVAVIDTSFAKLRLFKITELVAASFLLAVLAVFTLLLGGG